MTAFEKIIEAIQPFGYPYTAGVYEGKEKRWFTFNYSDDYGDCLLYTSQWNTHIVQGSWIPFQM